VRRYTPAAARLPPAAAPLPRTAAPPPTAPTTVAHGARPVTHRAMRHATPLAP
jgi:hypothetical protein